MFDPGGSESRLRTCAFLGTWRALLYGEVLVLERLVAICSVFWRIADSGFKNIQESYRRIVHVVRIAVNRFPPIARLALIMLCQAMGAGRAVRGDRKSGVNGCWGTSWSEELDGKELRGALGGKRNLEPRESSFSGQRLPIFLHRLRCGMLISKFSPCIDCFSLS